MPWVSVDEIAHGSSSALTPDKAVTTMLIHIVSRGDTLYGIARFYGVSLARLRSDNGLRTDDSLVVGQALIVTLPEETYTVRRGDTLSSIAARSGLTVRQLWQNNPELVYQTYLQPGQTLTLRFRGEKRRTITTVGYAYPHIRREVLLRALPYLTYLSIFSYGFRPDGSLLPADDAALLEAAARFGAAPVLVLTTIGEDGGFSQERLEALLYEEGLQDAILSDLVDTMLEKGYFALDVDFEYIPARDGEAYLNFLRAAGERMAAAGLQLFAALPPKTYAGQPGLLYEAQDYGAVGSLVDQALLMTYEWGYTYGPPMAVAPLPQVRDVVRYAVTEIPAAKLLLGIPNYGYDWTLPYEQGVSRAVNLGNEAAVRLAARTGAEIQFSEEASSPFFRYRQNGAEHVVWFEDVRSIDEKLLLADSFGLSGVGYWNIMRPFAQNWALLAARYDIRTVTGL